MTTVINNQRFQVKETNGKFFYFSVKNGRWMPISKNKVEYGI